MCRGSNEVGVKVVGGQVMLAWVGGRGSNAVGTESLGVRSSNHVDNRPVVLGIENPNSSCLGKKDIYMIKNKQNMYDSVHTHIYMHIRIHVCYEILKEHGVVALQRPPPARPVEGSVVKRTVPQAAWRCWAPPNWRSPAPRALSGATKSQWSPGRLAHRPPAAKAGRPRRT